MTDFSALVDATLVLLGVAAVLFMGSAMISQDFVGMTASGNSGSDTTPPQRYWDVRKAA